MRIHQRGDVVKGLDTSPRLPGGRHTPFHRFAARAAVIEDPAEIRRIIVTLSAESRANAQRLFGWDPQTDRITAADFSPLIEHVLFVKFTER